MKKLFTLTPWEKSYLITIQIVIVLSLVLVSARIFFQDRCENFCITFNDENFYFSSFYFRRKGKYMIAILD